MIPERLLNVAHLLVNGQRALDDVTITLTRRDGGESWTATATASRAEYLTLRYSRAGWDTNPKQRYLVEVSQRNGASS